MLSAARLGNADRAGQKRGSSRQAGGNDG